MEGKKEIKVSLGTVICMFIILVLIIALGIIYYIGFVKDDNKALSNEVSINKENSIISSTPNSNTEIIVKQTTYSEFAVAKSEDLDMNYIIGKDENNNWNELIEKKQDVILCGEYNDKLYFADAESLSYIDLNKTPYSEIKWLTYKDYQAYDNGEMGRTISKATMIEDTIYFEYGTFSGGSEPTDGILTIKVTDTSIDDAVQFIAKAYCGKWEIDAKNKILYYIEYNDLVHSLYKYDLNTGKQEVIINGISVPNSQNPTKRIIKQSVIDFEVYSDKILCLVTNQSTEPDTNGYYPATESLHLYDITTEEDKIINTSNKGSHSGGLWSFAEYHNDDVYYKSGDNIIKYNNGKNDIIYRYSANDGGESIHGESGFYGFYFIDNNIIELVLQSADNKYFVNGKVVTEPTGISTITVKMKNGSIKDFAINNIRK